TMSILSGLIAVPLAFLGAWRLLLTSEYRISALQILSALLLQIVFIFSYNIPDISDYFLGLHVLSLPLIVAGGWFAILSIRARLRIPDGGSVARYAAIPALLILTALATNYRTAWPSSRHLPERF